MSTMPLEDIFTDDLQKLFEDYDDGVIYVLDFRGKLLCEKTQASFRIDTPNLIVLHPVEILITVHGAVSQIVAERSNGEKFVGPSGCGCGRGHPVPVEKGDTVTIVAGVFPVV